MKKIRFREDFRTMKMLYRHQNYTSTESDIKYLSSHYRNTSSRNVDSRSKTFVQYDCDHKNKLSSQRKSCRLKIQIQCQRKPCLRRKRRLSTIKQHITTHFLILTAILSILHGKSKYRIQIKLNKKMKTVLFLW